MADTLMNTIVIKLRDSKHNILSTELQADDGFIYPASTKLLLVL